MLQRELKKKQNYLSKECSKKRAESLFGQAKGVLVGSFMSQLSWSVKSAQVVAGHRTLGRRQTLQALPVLTRTLQ